RAPSWPCFTGSCGSTISRPTAPAQMYSLPLHDALPISQRSQHRGLPGQLTSRSNQGRPRRQPPPSRRLRETASGGGEIARTRGKDRKSTRLNSSHVKISYAVFCTKKKKNRS